MFSFRRRKSSRTEPEPTIRGSPSLPQLTSQGIPWPENLVHKSALQQEPASADAAFHSQGAAKTSLHGIDHTPIPFHKPFRASPGQSIEEGMPISSMYMSVSPPTFDNRKVKYGNGARYPGGSQRRAKLPPTFNLMVVGGQGTGKTSLIRLLLDTADISPASTMDQRVAVDRFLRGPPKPTQNIQTACVEICESRFDRLLFSVIDTPGLDFQEGRELKLDRQVSAVIKYVDAQYADTMMEESKVVRKNKGDQHIHLCIYMIDPLSIMTQATRQARSSLPTKTRSETTISYRNKNPPDLIPDTSSGDESEDEDEGVLTMSPAEVRIIRRLATKCNVLPVIAKSDSLTDDKLSAVKQVVQKTMADAGLDFGIFTMSPTKPSTLPTAETPKRRTQFAKPAENGHLNGSGDGTEAAGSDEDEERQSRPVIKLRPARHPGRALSRSRSRRDLSRAAEDDRRPHSPDHDDRESIPNVRFSAHIVAKADLGKVLPFALIAPESTRRRHRLQTSDSHVLSTAPSSPVHHSEDGHTPSISESIPPTPASATSSRLAYLDGPPEDLKGVFVRKFRWGTIDVLEPAHCDFAALRTAILSTHLTVLKTHTKEVLYERYRTEKLLARRATQNISEDERQRLLEDLGL